MRTGPACGTLALLLASAGTAVCGAGPVVHLRFDETRGLVAADSSGGGHDAVLEGLPGDETQWVPGRIGGGVEFNGQRVYCELSLPRGGSRPAMSSRLGSVAFWFRTTANFKDPAMVFYGSPVRGGDGYGEQDEMHVSFDDREHLVFFIMGWGNLVSPNVYVDGRWHHLAATWDIRRDMRLYVDGRLDCSTNHPRRDFALTAVQRLGRPGADRRYYRGTLDDFRLYDRVLSADEVDALRRFVSFEAAAGSGDERRTPVRVAVVLPRAYDKPVSVDYSVAGGTASEGVDYAIARGTLTFEPGRTRRIVSLEVLPDATDEADETVVLALWNASGAVVGTVPRHTYTINEHGIVSRELVDLDGDRIPDGVRMRAHGALDDDFTGLAVSVAGREVTGFSTGVALDEEFTVLLAGTPKGAGAAARSARAPVVAIESNTSLRVGGSLLPADTGPNAPVDAVPPEVVATSPADGHGSAPVAGGIGVTFSEAMDRGSVGAAFAVSSGRGGKVTGRLAWASDSHAVFTPEPALAELASYTVTVGPGASDVSGNALGAARRFAFKTGNGVSVRFPRSSATSPACIEGSYWFRDGRPRRIVARGPAGEAAATALGETRFYVDVPLDEEQNEVSVGQEGAVPEIEASGRVTWTRTVVGTDAAAEVVVRRGDALRLAVEGDYGAGATVEFDLDYDGAAFRPDVRGKATGSVKAAFGRAGEFTVRASVGGVVAGETSVVVIDVDFPGRIACEVGCPLREGVTIAPVTRAADVFLGAAEPELLEVSPPTATRTGVGVDVTALRSGSPRLVARLCGARGAIVAHREVDEFVITGTIRRTGRRVAGVGTGTLTLAMEPKVPDVALVVEFTSGGVTIGGRELVVVESSDLGDDGTWVGRFEQTTYTIIRYRLRAERRRAAPDFEEVF